MVNSSFEQPLALSSRANAAVGHGWDRRPVAGGWHTYPEMAAAGLAPGGHDAQLQRGGNFGYRCHLFASAHRGQGAVVMTNADSGMLLINEVLRSIAAEYGWPDYRPAVRTAVAVDREVLLRHAGRYRGEDGTEILIIVERGRLVARLEGATLELLAESRHRFLETEQGFTFTFDGAKGDRAAIVSCSFRGRQAGALRVVAAQPAR